MWASFALLQALIIGSVAARNVSFAINLTWEYAAPDGFSRQMILINGTTPGPALHIEQGDHVEFLVHNNLPTDCTVHFHGITQLHTTWSDGVPGISQKPIQPGASFLYRWTADESGTYWYHGHFLSDISDGLFGPIHINPKRDAPTPYGLINSSSEEVVAMNRAARHPNLVTITDWVHLNSTAVMAAEETTNLDLSCTNSLLINGRGQVNCLPVEEYMSLAAPSTLQAIKGHNITAMGCSPPGIIEIDGNFTFNLDALPPILAFECNATEVAPTVFFVNSTDRWASFNFILSASIQTPMISIDDHEMWIYAADGQFIEPQKVDGVLIYTAQRYSALVRLKDDPEYDSYTMRFSNVGGNQILFVTALMSYSGSENPGTVAPDSYAAFNQAGNATSNSVVTLDSHMVVPYPAIKPAQISNATHIYHAQRDDASWRWTMSGTVAYNLTYNEPLLYNPNETYGLEPGLTIRTINGTWVDIIVLVDPSPQNPTQPPHAFHKHSNKAFVIGSGNGDFNYTSVAEAMQAEPSSFNLDNPPYRDSFVSGPQSPTQGTWIAIRYQSMNPGAFIVHCHITTHLTGGMAMAVLDGVDVWPTIPANYGPDSNGF